MDTSDMGSGNIHVHYRKLPDDSENNRKETVKPDTLYVILDLAKFSHGRFQYLNRSKGYRPEIGNISTRPSKLREIVYMQKFVILGWRAQIRISTCIFLPFATIYQLDNYKYNDRQNTNFTNFHYSLYLASASLAYQSFEYFTILLSNWFSTYICTES